MQSKTTAKDFFLYLGIIIGLYVTSISFLVLVFQIIDKTFPLAGEYIGSLDTTIRSSLAALIIFTPTFLYLLTIADKDLRLNPEKKDMWVRRWMIFLTMFVTGLTIAIDLVTLVYRFLGAEDLTLRFFLKVFFVFAVAITIFKFELIDLKRTSYEISKQLKIAAGVVLLIILSAIVYGIIIIGSPAAQRAKMLDATRVNDLSSIQNQIVYSQWKNKGTVPASLDALKDPISGYTLPTDPETNASYEYRMITKNSFELCATFKTIATTTEFNAITAKPVSYPAVNNGVNENWTHGIGRTCFTRTIDPQLYPINTKISK